MNKVCLVVLIGVPGAGKTTFCERFRSISSKQCSLVNVIHVCFDKFIKLEDKIDLDTGRFKAKRQQLLESLGALIEGIKLHDQNKLESANEDLIRKFNENISIDLSAQPRGKIYGILVDDNMYYRSMRYEVLGLARKYQTGFLQLFFNVPFLEAKVRNNKRANPISDEIMLRMRSKLEKPNEHFYKWERNTMELDGKVNFDYFPEIEHTIVQCANAPEASKEPANERQPVEQSTLHKVDLLLRKTISDIMKNRKSNIDSEDLKRLSEQLVNRRKAILDDLKMGSIVIDPQSATSEQMRLLFE
ncbi:L-seryl-tRNA(Sec) kinase-like [Armigeres subalbatus]|uniref:L-seryl-tRNA(Sec) kinase-like n=1 Tax=Armigeres subalbatus TaxID=124917 RepID=UPI002ED07C68